MTKNSLYFRYYGSDKNFNIKTQRRTSEIDRSTNVSKLDEFIEDDIFTKSY